MTNKTVALPDKLETHLPDARIARLGHLSELPTGKVASRIQELRVVEHVEELGSQFNGGGFGNLSGLVERKVGIQNNMRRNYSLTRAAI